MARNSVRININSQAFRDICEDKITWSEQASKFGVSKQAINGWLSDGRIPPRALLEIANDLNLTSEDIKRILDKPKKRMIFNVRIIVTEDGEEE